PAAPQQPPGAHRDGARNAQVVNDSPIDFHTLLDSATSQRHTWADPSGQVSTQRSVTMRGHSSAIGHHHGLSRGRVPSPAEPSHPVENVIPAATPYRHRNAERRPLQVRSHV